MWHMTPDMWHVVGLNILSDFSSLTLTFWVYWCFEDLEENHQWVTELMNEWRRCLKEQPRLHRICWIYIFNLTDFLGGNAFVVVINPAHHPHSHSQCHPHPYILPIPRGHGTNRHTQRITDTQTYNLDRERSWVSVSEEEKNQCCPTCLFTRLDRV